MTDEDLQQLLRTDGEKAIVLIFERYYAYLCKAVYRIIPDNGLVEDLAQEVFYELWRKREQLSVTASMRAYIRRAAINKALNFVRDQRVKFSGEAPYPIADHRQPRIDQLMEADELQAKIDRTIDRLPSRCRVVFILSRFEGMSYAEIAEQLDISVKTVENQISKALKTLRTELSDYLSN